MTSLLNRLKAAAENAPEDTSAFVLANIENILKDRPPELRRVLNAAAVPHHWDVTVLTALLDADLAPYAPRWVQELTTLPIIERIPGSDLFAVHEVSRLALRQQMHRESKLEAYARRALLALGPRSDESSPADEVERIYHLLVAEPEGGANALEETWLGWQNAGRNDFLSLLASALEDLAPQLAVPVRGVALLLLAKIRLNHASASLILNHATAAEQILNQLGQRRRQAMALDVMGDIHVALGQLSPAEKLYQKGLKLRQGLLELDPTVSRWQRDLSMSFIKLGDLATAQGNLPEAQRLFGEALRITQRLAESDPANAQWQRDLSYSYTIIGQLLMRQERWAEALPLLEQSLAINERLSASDPSNVMWQKDVAVSRRLVSEVQRKSRA